MNFYEFKDHASNWFQSNVYKGEHIVLRQHRLSGTSRTTRLRQGQS